MRASKLVVSLLLFLVTTSGCYYRERYVFTPPVEKLGTVAERVSAVGVAKGWTEKGEPLSRFRPSVFLQRNGPPEATISIRVDGGKPELRLWVATRDDASREAAYKEIRAEFATIWTEAVGDLGYPVPTERLKD